MIPSDWKCPDCKQNLFISNGGDYWCTSCQGWKDADNVDPMMRDFTRVQIVMDGHRERLVNQ